MQRGNNEEIIKYKNPMQFMRRLPMHNIDELKRIVVYIDALEL